MNEDELFDVMQLIHIQRIMSYIESGKQEGATLHSGGVRHGTEGYFIQPTILTDCKPHMKIVKEEIFGPVAAVIKFKDEAGVCDDRYDRPTLLICEHRCYQTGE
jgi:aldehyde dehydrogenase (NAD+)